MAVHAELVSAVTADGLVHHGLRFGPPDGGSTWVIHVHGSCSNFYQEPFILPLASALTARGATFLTVNTRGHDAEAYVIGRSADLQRESWQIGTRRDVFGECVHDLQAWLAFARGQNATRIILSGHSAGAVKVAHVAAQTADPPIAGLIALAPGDPLARNLQPEGGPPLDAQLAEARELVADDPAAMRPGRFLSAAAFLATFDHLDEAGVFAFSDSGVMAASSWPKLAAPALVVFAGRDAGYATPIDRNVELLEQLRRPGAPLRCEVLAATDHYFAGKEGILADVVAGWLAELP